LQVKIWREPDLSGEFEVQADGQVILPRIGAVHVEGRSADSLRRELVLAYEKYLRNPSIEVTAQRKVTIAGAVRRPGVYHIDPTISVVDAIAMAEGVTPDGRQDRVDILSASGERVTIDLEGTAVIGDMPLRSGDQLYVPLRSWISRNAGIVAATISATALLAGALITQ
jgi:polysaccharide export outer membrane protein